MNIRANGTLDVPDEALAGLDWVVASIHAAFSTSPTERVLAAMENPHVDCIGHLTGRKINKRGADGRRPRARLREGGRDRHRARDQLAARPARPARRRRARSPASAACRIVVSTDAHSTAALGYVAARHRPGAPRVADEGAGREHAPLVAGREAAQAK